MRTQNEKPIDVSQRSPAEKLRLSAQLYRTAWMLKRTGLRWLHPDWPEQKIARELQRIFLHARS